ncbi:hypothetical protein GCM10023157_15380 [Gluconacetobacter asukensis]
MAVALREKRLKLNACSSGSQTAPGGKGAPSAEVKLLLTGNGAFGMAMLATDGVRAQPSGIGAGRRENPAVDENVFPVSSVVIS